MGSSLGLDKNIWSGLGIGIGLRGAQVRSTLRVRVRIKDRGSCDGAIVGWERGGEDVELGSMILVDRRG